jgi:hypothetical protein
MDTDNETTTLSIPTVHGNGTGGPQLIAQLRDARTAVKAALEALANARPHGRDYYTQGPDAFAKARDEHTAREAALQTVEKELMTVYYGVFNQVRR